MQLSQNRRGNAAIEFALVLPVMLLLTLPPLEFSWYFLTQQAMVEAAQSGARTGAKTEGGSDPIGAATAATNRSLEASLPTSMTQGPDPATVEVLLIDGDIVQVTVQMSYQPIAGLIDMPPVVFARHRMKLERP